MLADDLLQGAKAAAAYSGLSERTIYHLAASGLLPRVKKGKRLYFRKGELDAALSGTAQA